MLDGSWLMARGGGPAWPRGPGERWAWAWNWGCQPSSHASVSIELRFHAVEWHCQLLDVPIARRRLAQAMDKWRLERRKWVLRWSLRIQRFLPIDWRSSAILAYFGLVFLVYVGLFLANSSIIFKTTCYELHISYHMPRTT